jgi:hypothetical protein
MIENNQIIIKYEDGRFTKTPVARYSKILWKKKKNRH